MPTPEGEDETEYLIGKKIQDYKRVYRQHKLANNVDFGKCHPAWQTSSMNLAPVNVDNQHVYYYTAIPAMVLNCLFVLCFLVVILRKDIHSTTYRDSYRENALLIPAPIDNQKQAVWDSKSKLSSAWKILLLISPMISCLVDSVLDGLYFISLKTEPRIIHVPGWVHVIQGLLLYTG